MTVDQQTIEISLEDVANLRRMHAQQFKRLTDAQQANDGPVAGQVLVEMVESHLACTDLMTVVEYMLTHWTPPAASTQSEERP